MPATLSAETVGPVDVAILRFDGNRFNGDIVPALRQLEQDGTDRIIDLTFITKDADGAVSFYEATDVEVALAFEKVAESRFELLSDEDLELISDQLPVATSAMAVVWENRWLARLASALRESQAEVVSTERIPREAVLQAIAALKD
jgi:hypothetical protein